MTKTFSLFEWSAGPDYLGRLSLQQWHTNTNTNMKPPTTASRAWTQFLFYFTACRLHHVVIQSRQTHTRTQTIDKRKHEMKWKKISKSQGPASETISNKSNQTGSSSSNGRDFSVLLSLSFVTWHNCQRSSLNWSAIQSIKGRLCCIVQCIDIGPSQSAVELL
jgi:hypothetical protein